jgi:hypothetical protein
MAQHREVVKNGYKSNSNLSESLTHVARSFDRFAYPLTERNSASYGGAVSGKNDHPSSVGGGAEKVQLGGNFFCGGEKRDWYCGGQVSRYGLAGRSLPLETTNAKAVAAPSAPMIKGVALVLPWWSELVRGFGPLCRPAG